MGNCFRRQSTMQRDSEEWDSPMHEKHFPEGNNVHVQVQNYDNRRKLGKIVQDHDKSKGIASTATATEVKIKITKKQLEELLGRVDVKELSVEQVLVNLLESGSKFERHHYHQQAWKPSLQSIPE